MNRRDSLGRRRIYGLVLASIFIPALALAAPPPVVDSGTGAPNARTLGRITIGGVGTNINIRSFRWGATSPGGTGKPAFAEFYVVKAIDSTSPTLMLKLAQGANIPSVTIEVFSAGTTTVLATYELTTARLLAVTDADPGRSSSSGGQPLEEIGIGYRQLRITSGGISTCYDNVAFTSC